MRKLVLPILLFAFLLEINAQQKVTMPAPTGSKAVVSSHRGSYSRYHLGIGSFILSLPDEGKLASHPGFSFGGQWGAGLSDHFVLFFGLDYGFAPKYTIIPNLTTYTGLFIGINAGIGGTYYFLPSDMFISVIGNVSVNQFEEKGGNEIASEAGPGAILSVGKDWHISNRVRFGVAYSLNYASAKIKDKELLQTMFASLQSDKMTTIIHGFTFSLTLGPKRQQQRVN